MSIALPAPPTVPSPEGMKVDDYARAIGVPAPDGFRAAGNWHLIHVLPDDLDTLHACLRQRLDAVGPWKEARRRGADGVIPADDATARRVDARVRLLEATLEGWRVGRGRPVTWADIEGSGAISDKFVGQTRALLDDHARDPETLIQAIDALPYFHSAKTDSLREYLETVGVCDARESLSHADLLSRALATVQDDLADRVLERGDAMAFVESVLGRLDGGRSEAAS